MRDYKELKVWQESMTLVRKCYQATNDFPRNEQYGITSQMRRSAISIPSNIAEGCGRGTTKDLRRFLGIAYSSGCELGTQIEIARRLGLGTVTELDQLDNKTDEIRGMLYKFIERLPPV
jgi:four helix bundle protein